MDEITKTIKSFLEKYGLNKSDLTYLVAFSGGYDSMCLLHSLKNSVKNRIAAIHLNHKWRGEESDLEEQNCEDFCKSIGVEFYSESLSSSVAHTETAAREARYKFFESCAQKFNSRIVFTAHNKNDNVETLIYRISMGTGINGLQGICPVRGIFYRPLLDVCRGEIEKYCIDNGLKPNNDSSNSDIKYKRNLIRAKILPLLQEINPNLVDAVTSLSSVASDETEIVNEYMVSILDKISDGGKILTAEFLKLSQALQKRIIYQIFQENNLEYDRRKILKIWEFLRKYSSSKSGKLCSLTENLWIFASEKYIEIISKNSQNFGEILIQKEGKYEFEDWVFEIEKFSSLVKTFPDDKTLTAFVSFSNGLPENLMLRHRKDGDVIKPFGLSGTQKLKKYLNEKKIPNHEKDNLLFLAGGEEIFWAIGLGISDKIKVEDFPTHKLKLYKKEGI